MKIIYLIIFIIIFSFGCSFGDKSDPFYYNISNNCSSIVTLTMVYSHGYVYAVQILPNNSFLGGGASFRGKGINSYEEHETKMLLMTAKDQVIFQFPDGVKEIFTFPEFIAHAEKQMGERGRGAWEFALCPTSP